MKEEEEDDTVGGRERGVYVCVTSAVEENCLTVIRRLLNDNLPSSLRWLPFFFFFSSPPSLFCLFWEENTSPHSPCAASLRKNSQCGVIFTPGNPSFQRQYELPVSLYGRSQYRVISVDKLLQSNRCSAGDMN